MHWHSSVRIIDLVYHTTYVVCVNFVYKWRDLQFKVDSERWICLRNFSWQFYLLSEFVPEISWEEIVEEILFRILFWCLACGSNPGFSSNKTTHYVLDHGDFSYYLIKKIKYILGIFIQNWSTSKMWYGVYLWSNNIAKFIRLIITW